MEFLERFIFLKGKDYGRIFYNFNFCLLVVVASCFCIIGKANAFSYDETDTTYAYFFIETQECFWYVPSNNFSFEAKGVGGGSTIYYTLPKVSGYDNDYVPEITEKALGTGDGQTVSSTNTYGLYGCNYGGNQVRIKIAKANIESSLLNNLDDFEQSNHFTRIPAAGGATYNQNYSVLNITTRKAPIRSFGNYCQAGSININGTSDSNGLLYLKSLDGGYVKSVSYYYGGVNGCVMYQYNQIDRVVFVEGESDPIENSDYQLFVSYPVLSENNYAVVEANDFFQFQLRYSIPDLNLSDYSIQLLRYASSDRSGEPDENLLSGTLSGADVNGDFVIDTFTDVEEERKYYYKAVLFSPDNEIVASSLFVFESKSDDPDAQEGRSSSDSGLDLGWLGNPLRFLFVPNKVAMQQSAEIFKEKTEENLPFAYLYQFSDQWNVMEANMQEEDKADAVFAMEINFEGRQNSLTMIDTREESFPGISNFIEIFRTFIAWGLWLFFAWHIVDRISNITI